MAFIVETRELSLPHDVLLSLVVFQEVGEIVRLTSSNVWSDRRDGVMCLQSFLLNSGVLRLVPRASLGLILQASLNEVLSILVGAAP